MNFILLVDFGSTYTKLTMVDTENKCIFSTAKSMTTVDTDIMIGYNEAMKQLKSEIEYIDCAIIDRLVCSSAAGGLRMVASGLVKQLTAEAAKLACLGSGAKILDVFSQKLTKKNVEQITKLDPDMLLLAGGTDGGNHQCIIHNAEQLSVSITHIPYVAAGNKDASDDLEAIFEDANVYYQITDNVMPELNQIQIEPARNAIREIFMKKIIQAKGLGAAREKLCEEIIPTPMAVLKAAELLSKGTDYIPGWGPLMIVDIGGATTDIHSACEGYPTRPGAVQKGFVEPFLKRTVEGDLGMRIGAESLVESVQMSFFEELSGVDAGYIKERSRYLTKNVDVVAQSEKDINFDESLASTAVKVAVERHVGRIETVYSPTGMLFYQTGKDLSGIKTVIGTGGILVHSERPNEILKHSILEESQPDILKPKKPKIMIDTLYMLSAAGLLADKYPDLAMELMNKYLKEKEMNDNEITK